MPGGVVLRMLAMLDRRIIWRAPSTGKDVFLTFDDGPEPEVTPFVLDTLMEHGARATFFCLGRNVEQYPSLHQRILAEGHAVGHHTWDHPDGWRTSARAYYRSVLRGAERVGGPLFRPPYGHVGIARARTLQRRFQVVMWDVLAGDFRKGSTGTACARHVLRRAKAGSIIVLHDNRKSAPCLKEALPLILHGLAEKGYRCATLGPEVTNQRPR